MHNHMHIYLIRSLVEFHDENPVEEDGKIANKKLFNTPLSCNGHVKSTTTLFRAEEAEK